MNKFQLAAVIMLGAGLLLILVGFAAVKGDFMKLGSKNNKYVCEEYTAGSGINEIDINELYEGVEIEEADVDTVEIRYYHTDKEEIEIKENGGKLSFERKEKKLNISITIGFDFTTDNTHTIVSVPKNFNGEISVKTSSGSVKARNISIDAPMTLHATSGSVKADNIECKDMLISANSGSIHADDIDCGALTVTNTSGSISLEEIDADGDLSVTNHSGSLKMDKITCKEAFAANTSGGVKIRNITCDSLEANCNSGSVVVDEATGNTLKAKSTSGGVKIDDIAFDEIILKSNSGSVSGSINGKESDYSIMSSTTSGSNNLRDSRDGSKKLDVNTTSGSIRISFNN